MIICKDEVTGRVIVPKELAGQWVAWNAVGDAIIASGSSLPEVIAAAHELGEADPSFERVPPSDVRLVGAVR